MSAMERVMSVNVTDSESRCLQHPGRELDLYCCWCYELICGKCLATTHKHHDAEDITDAIPRLKDYISDNMNRLNTGVNDVEVIVRQGRYELQDMMCKRGVLTRDIRDRHALLQAAIDRYRDEALASLDDQIDDIKAAANLDSLQENLDELTKLQQRMHKAVDSGAGCELVTVAREMRCGFGSKEAVKRLTRNSKTTVSYPTVPFQPLTDSVLQSLRDFTGSASRVEMALSEVEVTVAENFRCGVDPGTEVYSLCPVCVLCGYHLNPLTSTRTLPSGNTERTEN
ncbi:hypothetical protein BaRGS_00027182 [Batillaria attramentaria]|uniref:B box-type domain-containing protein n=1 Tax=Batillaria attramentaria TaxID=370345 RepID=A0ABD0K395_9CAEN